MSDANAMSSPAKGRANSTAEVFAGAIALCVWFTLFVIGYNIQAKPYQTVLLSNADIARKLHAFLAVLFCYTPTNAAMLCCVASVCGGIFRRMLERQRQRLLSPSLPVLLLSLVFQGFVVYLVMASGIISFGGWDHFFDHPDPTQGQYVQLAVTCSLISLILGYSPGLFISFMGRLEKWLPQGVALQGAAPDAPASREVVEAVASTSAK